MSNYKDFELKPLSVIHAEQEARRKEQIAAEKKFARLNEPGRPARPANYHPDRHWVSNPFEPTGNGGGNEAA